MAEILGVFLGLRLVLSVCGCLGSSGRGIKFFCHLGLIGDRMRLLLFRMKKGKKLLHASLQVGRCVLIIES